MNARTRAEVIRAYLAAADAAERLQAHTASPDISWRREWDDLIGGTFNGEDSVAKYINEWIKTYYDRAPTAP